MDAMTVDKESVQESTSTMDAKGIKDDHPMAPEYADPWTRSANLEARTNVMKKRIEEINIAKAAKVEYEELTEEERKEYMEIMWLAVNQEILNQPKMHCTSLCAMCLPDPAEFEMGSDVKLKSIYIKRRMGWADSAKMPLIAPINATVGAVGGAVDGVIAGLATGIAVGAVAGVGTAQATNQGAQGIASAPGHILGAIAGTATGAVTSAAVLALAGVFMPIMGLFSGGGITGKYTRCSRVGFEAFVDGRSDAEQSFKNAKMSGVYGLKLLHQAMNYNKTYFEKDATATDNQILAADSEEAQTARNYNAIAHCEYLREHNFDVRHVAECMRHSMLCGSHGALLLPANDKYSCSSKSSVAMLEGAAKDGGEDDVSMMWKATKERGACVKLLCEYEGFKAGALATHPDRIKNRKDLSEEEKAKLNADFVQMNDCTDRFTTPDGEKLTLNSDKERRQFCSN